MAETINYSEHLTFFEQIFEMKCVQMIFECVIHVVCCIEHNESIVYITKAVVLLFESWEVFQTNFHNPLITFLHQ